MKNDLEKGFTLLELIVSIGLFLIAVTIGLGAVASLYNANNKSQSLSSIVNNLNYSIEGMARVMRFSNVYHCGSSGTLTAPQSCAAGDTSVAVTTAASSIIYRFVGSRIESSTDSGASYRPVTGSDVTIQNARFYVFNTTPGDNRQPYVLMVIKGYSGVKPSAQTSFDIETLVSQRTLDI